MGSPDLASDVQDVSDQALRASVSTHCVDFVAGTFSGTATFTAANGDQLLVLLEGKAGEYPACTPICAVTFTGTITSGGTGRFVDADGTLSGPGTVDLGGAVATFAGAGAKRQAQLRRRRAPLGAGCGQRARPRTGALWRRVRGHCDPPNPPVDPLGLGCAAQCGERV
jgi:hypothetical protein